MSIIIPENVVPIQLSQGYETLVDPEWFDYLSQWKWHVAEKRGVTYATRVSKKGKKAVRVGMHQVIVGLPLPYGVRPDHRNGNGLHNWAKNLRLATAQQNVMNARPKIGKKYKGVCERPNGRFQVRIAIHKETIDLGCFDTEIEGALAYDAAAKIYHGEWAYLNFP